MIVTNIEQAAAQDFDYIICGGGTAGLCIAARLTEDPNVTVLVLEAGGYEAGDKAILALASWGSQFGNPKYDWGFETVKQKESPDGKQQYPWSRGKVLGGSSAINFSVWTKPPAEELNDFERLGNPGWNWENINKCSMRAEKFTIPSAEYQEKHKLRFRVEDSGTDGVVRTGFPEGLMDFEAYIRETFLNAGLPLAKRPLGGDPCGVFHCPNLIDTTEHTRSYAASAYFEPNKERSNMHVLLNALVTKVVTTEERGDDGLFTATGVNILHSDSNDVANSGKPYSFKARREVILCTGGLKTPHVLELSGIGGRTVLEAAGIPVKIELSAVGENIQEHTFSTVCWQLKDDVELETFDMLMDPALQAEQMELYTKHKKGLFTSGMTGMAFAPLNQLSPRAKQLHQNISKRIRANESSYSPGLLAQYEILLGRLEHGAPGCELVSFPGFNSGPNMPEAKKKCFTMGTAPNYPFSRGTIHTRSSDPTKEPDFDPHYFEEQIDMDTVVDQIKWIRKLAEVEPLKSMIESELNPGVNVTSDEALAEYVTKNLRTAYHTCGGASMLPKNMGGVVDNKLIVYGTKNLRVADLSIVPLQFSSHPMSVVYGIAEQAADIIRGKFEPLGL